MSDVIFITIIYLSWCSYLFNLVGQFIGVYALQDQCCRIVSALLKAFRDNPSKEIVNVLGEQLQVLIRSHKSLLSLAMLIIYLSIDSIFYVVFGVKVSGMLYAL